MGRRSPQEPCCWALSPLLPPPMKPPPPPSVRPRQRVQQGTPVVHRECHTTKASEASDVTPADEVVLILAAVTASLELKELDGGSSQVAEDVGGLAAVHSQQVGVAPECGTQRLACPRVKAVRVARRHRGPGRCRAAVAAHVGRCSLRKQDAAELNRAIANMNIAKRTLHDLSL